MGQKIMRKRITEDTLYKFNELSDSAQDTAVGKLWNINVEDSYWYEFIGEDIANFGKTSGLGCIYGNEFDIDRGSFIYIKSISCTLGELQANYGKTANDYPDVAREVLKPFLTAFTPSELRHLATLENRNLLGALSGETAREGRGQRIDVDSDVWKSHKRAYALVEKLSDFWDELVRDLEHYYVQVLTREYEYQTGREAIIYSIEANEYEFYENGTIA